jgi:SAM-dependent methyltransferase
MFTPPGQPARGRRLPLVDLADQVAGADDDVGEAVPLEGWAVTVRTRPWRSRTWWPRRPPGLPWWTMDDEDGHFDEQAAATYDDSMEVYGPGAVDATVAVLAELARGGRALELGVGTGRIALPLSQRGIEVHGIDLSGAMVARLRAKPGGDRVGVSIGDFATTRVDGTFSLAYLVFNTIMNLTTQEAQVACFRNVAVHLEPGGSFVIEVRVPDLRRLPPGQDAVPWHISSTQCVFYSYDVATQAMHGHYVHIADGRCEYSSMPFRYVWPAELDLMAQLAGLRLRHRWGGWAREPFTSESRQHVSVWERPAAG